MKILSDQNLLRIKIANQQFSDHNALQCYEPTIGTFRFKSIKKK